MAHVRYIDRTREYYRSEGYTSDYRWAQFDEVPFTTLATPLPSCRLGLVTTGEVVVRGGESPDDLERRVYALPTATPPDGLISRKASYDRYATTLDDVNAYLPLAPLAALEREGRIGGVAPRFQVVFSQYSQRRTMEVDAPAILQQCREDGVDAVLLCAV